MPKSKGNRTTKKKSLHNKDSQSPLSPPTKSKYNDSEPIEDDNSATGTPRRRVKHKNLEEDHQVLKDSTNENVNQLQEEVVTAREREREHLAEIEELRLELNKTAEEKSGKTDCQKGRSASDDMDESDEESSLPESRRRKLLSEAMTDGRKLCVTVWMWGETSDAWGMIKDVNTIWNADEDEMLDFTDEEFDEQNRFRDGARSFLRAMTPAVRGAVKRGDQEVITRVADGFRSIRSGSVSRVQDKAAEIFEWSIDNKTFSKDRGARRSFDEVQRLLREDRFMYADDQLSTRGYMRGRCLILAGRYLLLGSVGATSEKASTKSRKTNCGLWKLEKVTPEFISFVTTCCLFVLSGESTLRSTGEGKFWNYKDFFRERCNVFENWGKHQPKRLNALLAFWDRELFGDDGPQQPALSAQDQRLLAEMEAGESDSDVGGKSEIHNAPESAGGAQADGAATGGDGQDGTVDPNPHKSPSRSAAPGDGDMEGDTDTAAADVDMAIDNNAGSESSSCQHRLRSNQGYHDDSLAGGGDGRQPIVKGASSRGSSIESQARDNSQRSSVISDDSNLSEGGATTVQTRNPKRDRDPLGSDHHIASEDNRSGKRARTYGKEPSRRSGRNAGKALSSAGG